MSMDFSKSGYEEFRKKIADSFSKESLQVIDQAFDLAFRAHHEQKRKSGEPYIIHPIAVADILFQLGMDPPSLETALLHDVVEDTPVTLDEIRAQFGDEVANLVDGVTKIGKIPLFTREEQQAENLRKMLLAMSQDIRVIIVKLADRLHNMRTLQYVPEQRRREIARETLEIYAPIAHRLGIRAVKEELEDRAIMFLDPIAYKEISDQLAAQSSQRTEFLEGIKEKIRKRILPICGDAAIEGRVKSVNGIYRKMYLQNKNFDQIYDIYAVRIILDTVTDCYNCLGIIHDMFRPIPGRFKDYISTPKPNMYQSLHTTLLSREGLPFEVQIRTWEMHRTAEYGVAAHWKYKLGMNSGKEKPEMRMAWIRQLLETQNSAEDVTDIVAAIKNDLVPDEVYTLTPRGDVICLPQGSTVIDFAYAIHSAVGNRMTGAKVDGRIVPIDYQVKTGEIVEILTSAQQGKGPSRDWLNIVKTGEARNKIRMWFKKERRDENIVEGKAELERELKRSNIRLPEEEYNKFISDLAERYHCKDADDFYTSIGYGGVVISRIMPHIRDEYNKLAKPVEPQELKPTERRVKHGNDGIVIEGIDNCLVKVAKCCNPIPGDKIIGYITRGRGVSVHKRDCPNVPKDIEHCSQPERWLKAYWDADVKEDFCATLHIACVDRYGLMADITAVLANMHVMILNVYTVRDKSRQEVTAIVLTLSVSSIEHLRNVTSRLDKINGVVKITRS